jgi:hypothetical protein
MRIVFTAILAGILFAGAPSLAQQEQGAANVHPQPILQGQSTTPAAPAGGIDQAGVATPPAQFSIAAAAPLPPGPPAGEQRAAELSNVDMIAGGAAITAIIVCAIACFSSSSTSTTSTTATHR